jgi:hypothetical protein
MVVMKSLNSVLAFLGARLYEILVWLDQGINVIFLAGSADETVSSRVGKACVGAYGPRWVKPAIVARTMIDWVFLKLFGEANHCARSIEWDEGRLK